MSRRAERDEAACPRCALRRGGVAAALTVSLLMGGVGTALAVVTPAAPRPVPATSTASLGESWAAELALDGGDDSGLVLSDGGVRLSAAGTPGRPAEGVLTLAPRRLAAPTSGLAEALTADLPPGTGVDVQARGLDRRGVWGDWLPVRGGSPARFGSPTVDVQVRLLLHGAANGATPVVREVWLSALGVTPTTKPAPTTTTTTTTRPTTTTKPTTTTPTTTTKPTTTTPTTTTKPTTTKPTTTTPTTTTPSTTTPATPTTKPGPPTRPTRPTPPGPPKPTTTTTPPLVAVPPVAIPPVAIPPVAIPPVVVPQIVPAAATVTPTTTTPTTTTTTTTTTSPAAGGIVVPPVAALWDAAIATTGLTGFKDTPYNVTGSSSVTVVDAPTKAIRFTVPAGSQRAEIEPDVGHFTEGETRYFRVTYVLPPSFPTDPQGFQLATQWKNDGDGSPPLELRVERGRFVLGGGYARPGGSALFSTDIAPVVTGRAVDIVAGIRFSSDPAKGRVDVWIDGQQKLTDYRPPGGTLYPGQSSYWKVGLYRDTANTTSATADLTGAALGNTYDAVRGSSDTTTS
ncbi:polysaccharide lyase [Actinomycetospora sp.]|uniref:polysaccharide lyase n=1 Tax=Actinomycetospora sp. TaxID=1872135 RepID=UPI002F3FAE15